MPIYEYRRADGTVFEVMQSMSDDTLTTDPETGEPVTKIFSAPAIKFHGSGFYSTDVGTQRGNRELERAAESGADAHDHKFHAERAQKAKAKKDADRRRNEAATARKAAQIRGEKPKTPPPRPPAAG